MIEIVKEKKKPAMTNNELVMLQALPLEIKIAKTKARIREAIKHFGIEGVYVPVSGGKDSMVLSHIVEQVQQEDGIEKSRIPRVNSNTGNEYDDVLALARELSDIEVRPKMQLYDVLTYVGYPVASKKTSRMLRDLQNPTEKNKVTRNLYLNGIKKDGTKSIHFKLAKKWQPFIDSDVRVSEKCCDILKKEPMHTYEKETGRIPLIGTMASEGGTRKNGYIQTGCNAFHIGKSMPIGFWKEQDVLQYILDNKLKMASVYGEIVEVDGKLTTTGEKRTGCVWCVLGSQMEDKNNNRFHKLKKNDYKKWKFAMLGGETSPSGRWRPKHGLGMGHVLDLMGIDYGAEKELDGQISIEEIIE